VHLEGREPGEVFDLHGLSQVLWPVHCVQGTPGSDFVGALEIERVDAIFPKGTDPEVDSYSGFYDNGHRKATGLGEWLRERGVDAVYVLGVATDYCVKFTALDAIADGFETYLVEDGVRGVNLRPGDSEAAIEEMRRAGAHVVSARDV
ncbi:MAG: bifunctional nicotinamidase/pyrazinamidase, partial [Myxococcota bacterium]